MRIVETSPLRLALRSAHGLLLCLAAGAGFGALLLTAFRLRGGQWPARAPAGMSGTAGPLTPVDQASDLAYAVVVGARAGLILALGCWLLEVACLWLIFALRRRLRPYGG